MWSRSEWVVDIISGLCNLKYLWLRSRSCIDDRAYVQLCVCACVCVCDRLYGFGVELEEEEDEEEFIFFFYCESQFSVHFDIYSFQAGEGVSIMSGVVLG